MSLIKGGISSFISVAFISTAVLASSQSGAVTIRFTSSATTVAAKKASDENKASKGSEQHNSLVEAAAKNKFDSEKKLGSIDASKMIGEIAALKSELTKEKNSKRILGRGEVNQVFIGTWNLDPQKTLEENLSRWVQEAQIETGHEIKLIWEAPGPGVFKVPYTFKGTWTDAFDQLGHALESSPQWSLKISVNTLMNTVLVKAIQN